MSETGAGLITKIVDLGKDGCFVEVKLKIMSWNENPFRTSDEVRILKKCVEKH